MAPMSPILQARRLRIRTIRHRITSIALVTFAAAWGVVAFDGSMGTQAVPNQSASATQQQDQQDESSDDETWFDWGDDDDDDEGDEAEEAPPMTTTQS